MSVTIANGIKLRFVCALLIIGAPMLPEHTHAQSEFEQWQAEQNQAFRNYQSAQDGEFSEFLKKQWQEFELFQGITRDPTPKPKAMPVAPNKGLKQANKASKSETGDSARVATPHMAKKNNSTPITLSSSRSQRKHPSGTQLHVDFFGEKLSLNHNPKLAVKLKSHPSESSIGEFWAELSSANHQPLLNQLQQQKQSLWLNDWGYIQLVLQVATELYGNHGNEAKLFTWFILSHSEYRARVGHDGSEVFLMVAAKTPFYSTSYLSYDGVNYYIVSMDGQPRHVSKLFSYAGHTPHGNQDIDLILHRSPRLAVRNESRTLQFNYKGKQYQIDADYNRNIVDYLKTYPSSELSVYFRAAISKELNTSLTNALSELIKGKSELEATNLLLRFVQTAFEYKTDEAQFGREKYFFPEELFVYDYSDCEDRSVLFAYLVRTLLHLDVVGIDYPGHVATAVHFNQKVEGQLYLYNGKRYVISDPTYINASVGEAMPTVANKRAKIIPI